MLAISMLAISMHASMIPKSHSDNKLEHQIELLT